YRLLTNNSYSLYNVSVVNSLCRNPCCFFFFFNDTATTEIYTLSLHDALPIWPSRKPTRSWRTVFPRSTAAPRQPALRAHREGPRSEEHTSELQLRRDLVCRLLLEKKKINTRRQLTIFLPYLLN